MNKQNFFTNSSLLGIALLLSTSCLNSETEGLANETVKPTNITKEKADVNIEQRFKTTLETHLKALEGKNLAALKPTLPKVGDIHLTLPDGVIINTTLGFIEMHEKWFSEPGWTIEHEIIKSENSNDYGYALVKAVYREQERNGKPYMHEMFVSYDLKNENGNWVVVKDHASTIKKEPSS